MNLLYQPSNFNFNPQDLMTYSPISLRPPVGKTTQVNFNIEPNQYHDSKGHLTATGIWTADMSFSQ